MSTVSFLGLELETSGGVVARAAIQLGIVDKPDGKLKLHGASIPYLGGIARHKRLRSSDSSQLVVQARPETVWSRRAPAPIVCAGISSRRTRRRESRAAARS